MEVQLVVASGSKAGQSIPIPGNKFIIGRAEDCHLKPRSELISRYHCAIISEDGYVAIRDLGSKNGVFLNGERVPLESELNNGDKLTIGPLEFVVQLSVSMKAPKKPRVETLEAAVVRTVEISKAPEIESVVASVETKEPKSEPVRPAPPTEAPIPAPVETPREEPKIEEGKKEGDDPAASSPGLNIADWLLGDADTGASNEETKTVRVQRMPSAGVYTPEDVVPEEKEENDENKEKDSKSGGSSKFGQQKAASSRDAAANLLKNFFKGR